MDDDYFYNFKEKRSKESDSLAIDTGFGRSEVGFTTAHNKFKEELKNRKFNNPVQEDYEDVENRLNQYRKPNNQRSNDNRYPRQSEEYDNR